MGRESGVFACDVSLDYQILQGGNRSGRGRGCYVLCVILVYPSIGKGREDGWGMCLCCSNLREFTFA